MLRLVRNVPTLRSQRVQETLRIVLRAAHDRFGLRSVHYSAQSNHVHLLCEASDERALSRGMKGLGVRMAKALDALWCRKGKVLADRFHARTMRSPRQVRNTLAYVFGNARHHGVPLQGCFDPCSSAGFFDGWHERQGRFGSGGRLAKAGTWLLSVGWRRLGLLSLQAAPG